MLELLGLKIFQAVSYFIELNERSQIVWTIHEIFRVIYRSDRYEETFIWFNEVR